MSNERITMTMEEFDNALKAWRRKGAERAALFVLLGSIPVAIALPFLNVSPGQLFIGCATWYCLLTGCAAASS